jgi:predicted transcriptional regulator
MAELTGEPNYSTVRTQLRVLEDKEHVRHDEGGRYVYAPAVPRHAARKSALKHLVETFFDGSAEQVVAAVLGGEASRLTDEELDRVSALIESAKGRIPMTLMSLLVESTVKRPRRARRAGGGHVPATAVGRAAPLDASAASSRRSRHRSPGS